MKRLALVRLRTSRSLSSKGRYALARPGRSVGKRAKHAAFPLVLGVLLSISAAQAQTTTAEAPKKNEKIPELLREAVDPYVMHKEKQRFWSAAGNDNELSKKEFAANQGKPNAFVKSFDTWKAIAAFDKDGNGTVDWIEADEYRRDLRKRVLAAFDKNHDSKLAGPERDAANKALRDGTLGNGKRRGGGLALLGSDDADPDAELIRRFDDDGDGLLSEEELQTAMKTLEGERRKAMIDRYDADGDGELSDEERKNMRADRGGDEAAKLRDEFIARNFDDDGDGTISEEERAALKAWEKKLGQKMAGLRTRMLDYDGDGEVTEQEEKLAQREMVVFGLKMMLRIRAYQDTDGDKKVSLEEERAFNTKAATGMVKWFDGFTGDYDDNGDGRLSPTERDAVIEGISDEIDRRMTKHDANRDGHTSIAEFEAVVMEFGQDANIFPRPDETPEDKGEEETAEPQASRTGS